MEKPTINYALAYQKFRGELNSYVANLQQKIPIPTYMVEGILSSILSDVRSATITENALELDAFRESLDKYYEDREREFNDEILKLKAKDEEKA
ncbi:MAG: toxin [Erysipelotrichaceae bacterium]|uniref:toxin n=1 Tax=Streptococcus canis TaxID=1329 RepID=UPI0012E958B0|nr:toxin [Streptococcus canis]MDY6062376.1 toxin [Erysipelotrichaceae bacterium]QJD12580.1 toxin [Streptococcus canis]